jgi:hypothetical protein
MMQFQRVQDEISKLKHRGITVNEVLCTEPSGPDDLEKTLQIHLPASVRQFYSHYEYLQVGPYEFEWVRNLPGLVSRLRRQLHVPMTHLPILSDGMGGYYYVVCSEVNAPRPDNFGRAVHRPTGTADQLEIDCGDFLEFVLSRAANATTNPDLGL